MISLTYEQVRANAEKAYVEKRLSAQGQTPSPQYRDASNCPCAIGASLSDDDIQYVEAEDTEDPCVMVLHARGILGFPSSGEMRKARYLQYLHDTWAIAAQKKLDTKPFEASFKKVLTPN